MTKAFLTVAQAAAYAAVSETMIYQWTNEKRLPHFRLGGKGKRGAIRIGPDDFEGFLASLKVTEEGRFVSIPPTRKYRHVTL